MSIDKEMNLVIAGTGADGKPRFLERGEAQVSHTPGVVEVAFLWGVEGIPALPKKYRRAVTTHRPTRARR